MIEMMSDDRAYLATLGLSNPLALEEFLEAAPDAIVVVDSSGHIVIVNQLAERLFGYSHQELLRVVLPRQAVINSGDREAAMPHRLASHHRASFGGERSTRA